MEPAQAEKLKVNWVVMTEVRKVERETTQKHITGVGDKAEFAEVDLGWYVHFAGSYEKLNFGFEKPTLKPGDKIKITFEKVE